MTLDLWTRPHLISTFIHVHIKLKVNPVHPVFQIRLKGLVNCLKMIPLEFPVDSVNFEEEISGMTSADYCNIV